jgi:hypothetical protein
VEHQRGTSFTQGLILRWGQNWCFEHYSSVSNNGFILLSQDHFNNYILTWFVTLLSLYVLIELYLFDFGCVASKVLGPPALCLIQSTFLV